MADEQTTTTWDDVLARLDAMERYSRENAERMAALRLAVERWVQEWKEYQRGR